MAPRQGGGLFKGPESFLARSSLLSRRRSTRPASLGGSQHLASKLLQPSMDSCCPRSCLTLALECGIGHRWVPSECVMCGTGSGFPGKGPRWIASGLSCSCSSKSICAHRYCIVHIIYIDHQS